MYPEYEMPLGGGRLRWRCEYDDSCRLECVAADGRLLAMETEPSGFHLITDSIAWRASAVFDERGILSFADGGLSWSRDYPEHGVRVGQSWRRLDDETVAFTCTVQALRRVRRPHLGYGLACVLPPYFDRFAFAHNPTQMGYTFTATGQPPVTLWMYSLPPTPTDTSPYAGCQALVAENPDPACLEFHLRLPPGYVAETSRDYELAPGETLAISGAVALRPGAFHEHAAANDRLLGREILPPRHDFRQYIEKALDCFLDERKYHPEGAGDGILYYSAVDGAMEAPRTQYWTEGPSWGGACDAENACNVVLCAKYMPERREALLAHARRMLHGWLDNPRFRVPKGVFAAAPGDFDEAYVTTGWFPDCVWTIAQADLVLRLADLHLATGWPECLPAARRLGKWLRGRIADDGTIPAIWQFPVVYPPELGDGWRPVFSRCTRTGPRIDVLHGPQPTEAAFLALAFYKLAEADPDGAEGWRQAAHALTDYVIQAVTPPLAHFGNGECDYLVYRTESIDPTGIAYLLRGLAARHRHAPDDRIPPLLCRFMDIYSCFSVHWDCRETRLRPPEKCSMGPYGADIRLAGGTPHGNWQPVYRRGFGQRFNLLMNRNEIADAMLDAWLVSGRPADLALLRSFVNWQTYFQFENEVPGSPVSTRGSCQQNHFWTIDEGNWNNDYALTAFKWTGTFWHLIEAGITG